MDTVQPRTTTHDQVSPVTSDVVTFLYRNHRGEVEQRIVRPIRLWFGSTAWHPKAGWLLEGWDVLRQASRDFSMEGMMGRWHLAVLHPTRGDWVVPDLQASTYNAPADAPANPRA